MLSLAAFVAREHGIPAVLASAGHRPHRDGARSVNGTKGTVTQRRTDTDHALDRKETGDGAKRLRPPANHGDKVS